MPGEHAERPPVPDFWPPKPDPAPAAGKKPGARSRRPRTRKRADDHAADALGYMRGPEAQAKGPTPARWTIRLNLFCDPKSGSAFVLECRRYEPDPNVKNCERVTHRFAPGSSMLRGEPLEQAVRAAFSSVMQHLAEVGDLR